MSNCKRSRELINRKLDNDLVETELFELEKHLELCADCNAYYQKMVELHNKLLSIPVIDQQESIVDKLIIDIDKIKRESENKKWKNNNKKLFTRYGLTAAAIILLFFPIAFLANQNNNKELSDSSEFFATEAPDQNVAMNNTASILQAGEPVADGIKTADRNYSGQSVESFELYRIETENNQLVIYKNEDVVYKTEPWEDSLTVSFYQVNQDEICYSLFSKEDNRLIASYKINLLEKKEEKIPE